MKQLETILKELTQKESLHNETRASLLNAISGLQQGAIGSVEDVIGNIIDYCSTEFKIQDKKRRRLNTKEVHVTYNKVSKHIRDNHYPHELCLSARMFGKTSDKSIEGLFDYMFMEWDMKCKELDKVRNV